MTQHDFEQAIIKACGIDPTEGITKLELTIEVGKEPMLAVTSYLSSESSDELVVALQVATFKPAEAEGPFMLGDEEFDTADERDAAALAECEL